MLTPRPPRLCRPRDHRWEFDGALLSMPFLDGAAQCVTLQTCRVCHHALELTGLVETGAGAIRLTGLGAGLWSPRGEFQGVPLGER